LILGSSDIHYEVLEDGNVQVRFRIDGILVDIFKLEVREYKLILERLKYSSGLKLNITNIPQDGKYSMKIE
jgi:type IV pilus assembly protein PilB